MFDLPALTDFLDFGNLWFFIGIGVLWFIGCGVMIYSLRNPHRSTDFSSVRTNLGLFVMFVFLAGGLIYLFFGQAPAGTALG